MGAFPWRTEPSIQIVKLSSAYRKRFDSEFGPDEWACRYLDYLGKQITSRKFDGVNAVDPVQIAVVSGHGIGKSALVAWLIKFILDTRPESKGVVTAGTAEQLKTKTWAEVGKWHKMSITRNWFNYTSGRGSMMLVHREFKEKWRCDALTCKEENADSFQGLHAVNSTPFLIFDEASAIPDAIYDAREGATTDGEPMVFDFGNPYRNRGKFFEECEGRFQHRFKVWRIDSRDVKISNKRRIRQWLDDYGEDSNFFKVKVRGVFPTTGLRQFVSMDLVRSCRERELVQDKNQPLVLGVDIARFGENYTVIYPRQGRNARTFPVKRLLNLDSVQVVGHIIDTVREYRKLGVEVAKIFVDAQGLGGPVFDQLKHLGYNPYGVTERDRVLNKELYVKRTDELWGNLRDAMEEGLCLPDYKSEEGDILQAQLTTRQFDYANKGQYILETKSDLDVSPDDVDALALTYAMEVSPVSQIHAPQTPKLVDAAWNYDPYNMSD